MKSGRQGSRCVRNEVAVVRAIAAAVALAATLGAARDARA
jgi:hypothetical protein